MARILVALVALGFVVSLAPAETVIMEITVDRDNFNMNHSTTADFNAGRTGNYRFSKVKQEGTYYGDWDFDDLEALGAAIAAGPATPGNWLEVYFVIYGTSGATAVKAANVETLDSVTDWVEGNDDRGPSTGGASNTFSALGPIPWVDAVANPGTQVNAFWDLSSAFTNTAGTTNGWKNGTAATDANLILLDMPLVQHVISSPNNRGLRAFQTDWDGSENAGAAALGQWGGLGGGKLRLVEVPEPATMLLLGIGGLGVLLRKKR